MDADRDLVVKYRKPAVLPQFQLGEAGEEGFGEEDSARKFVVWWFSLALVMSRF